MTQLVDLIAINELTGTLESDGDGGNANIVAALPEESLSAQAAEFQASTNDDTIGWIQIPNTNVDYPVVYKAGVENYAYYESLGYDKQYSKDGVIWADYECTFPELSQNTTLYGHNWYNIYTPRTLENMQSNDLMFSLVMSYHYTDFAQQNPFIYFSTTEQDYVFQVFAAFYTDLSFGYNFANMTQEQTQQVIAEAKAKSRQNYNVSVTSEDKILTLSTCTRMYGNTNNQRFVVMAKLVPPAHRPPPSAPTPTRSPTTTRLAGSKGRSGSDDHSALHPQKGMGQHEGAKAVRPANAGRLRLYPLLLGGVFLAGRAKPLPRTAKKGCCSASTPTGWTRRFAGRTWKAVGENIPTSMALSTAKR